MPSDTSTNQSVFLISSRRVSYRALTKKESYSVLAVVVGLHVLIFILITYGLPDFKFNKRPDITIEIGAAPPASSGPVSQTKPAPVPTQKKLQKKKHRHLQKIKMCPLYQHQLKHHNQVLSQ